MFRLAAVGLGMVVFGLAGSLTITNPAPNAVELRTGRRLWQAKTAVYVGKETADRVIAYDVNTGQQQWVGANVLGGWQDGAPVAADGRVFVGSNNRLVARDAATGANLWTYARLDASYIPGNATPSAPAVVGDTLYLGFPDGRVTALNTATGAVVWSVRLPGKPYLGGVLSAPAVSGDTVDLGSNNGKLYAFTVKR
jgi:outer membrane protein assembly factor BamB